jgi:3',5'-cyclic-AMP phosphodiesterase
MRTTIVQLTDLHIRPPGEFACGRVDTARCLRDAVAGVKALPFAVDAVVVTGDLVDEGQPAEYSHLHELLAPLTCPVYLLAGNHDDRNALRSVLPPPPLGEACGVPKERPWPFLGVTGGGGGAGDLRYSVAIGELQLVALDTTVPGQPHGTLSPERLAWLADRLDACEGRPVIVAMHHPPFRTFIEHMDEMGLLQGAEELESLLRAHPNVERVICGHVHRAVQVRFGGTIASICPSPAHQVALDLRHEGVAAWTLEPGAFQVHAWEPGSGLVTHQGHVGPYEGPYPFDGDAPAERPA